MLESIRKLPSSYGVYQYFDRRGRLLYIGKAKNLKQRVKSYWRFTPALHPNPALGPRISKMLHEAERLEYLLVESEEDALILENSLIKQLRPKYNILLRDDKTYPYIYIDLSESFPRFELTRKIIPGKQIRYWGPFPSGGRALLDALYELYPLVQKKSGLHGGKACLFHQIGKCLAPCEKKIDTHTYHSQVITPAQDAILDRHIILDALQARMEKLALQERYEEAAKLRDQIRAISTLQMHSGIDLASRDNIDIFAIAVEGEQGVVVRMFMREGKIISSTHSFFRQTELFDSDEAYRQILLDFYTAHLPSLPALILVAEPFDSMEDVVQTLRKKIGSTLAIRHPKRGTKRTLIQLAERNAHTLLQQRTSTESTIESRIASLCHLDRVPYRIEIFDNSHMMGSATVGGMVVWEEGAWQKQAYRRYSLTARDEYGQMREMLQRRITDFDTQAAPDLWILDGGATLLKLAKSLLAEVGVNLDVIAIAKEKLDSKAHRAKGAARDILYTEEEILHLASGDPRLQWIQRLRDEAHRYALNYHRQMKRRHDTELSLLQAKGIGQATIKKLIDYFGSFEKIRTATFEELSRVIGKERASLLQKSKKK